ncbi:MAG TPA: xanthine dehydrogenase family protein molybdopterin-binding subunit [Amycolatopsis sp.]|nr:xanthine dehydrogenase family protein molybdopterin-binding subunit [Amycolatopsis sp.]
MPGSLLGTEVRRVEDPELLRGQGTYVDNLPFEGVLHAGFVRSPFAHALINGIDTSEAEKAPGVVAVYTGADLDLPTLPVFIEVNAECARHPLTTDRVRFAGEPVVAVIAVSPTAVEDALELVDIDYDPLPAAVDVEEALAADAPLQFTSLPSNLAAGERDEAGADVLAGADVVVRARIENQRIAVAPMEGNAIAAIPAESGDYDMTIYVSTQMPHGFKASAADVFGWEPDRVRVVAPHVGGGFGGKAGLIAEHVLVIEAARRLGRPVKWIESRLENMQAAPQGRAQVQYAELGFDADGKIVGMRCRVLADAGAYAGFGGALAMGPTRIMAPGVYRIPRLSYDGAVVVTNTAPVGAFRGAGRPEAAAMLERMMDLGAAELGIDPAELRRRNFLQPDQFPFTTLTGASYDSGDYDLPLTEALRLAGYAELRAEQARRIEAGEHLLLGIGMSAYVEITGGGGGEYASVEVGADGRAEIKVGTSGHGQGHPTSFSMIVSDLLGIPLDSVDFVQSDTAEVPRGSGTGGSRSLQLGGSAVRQASELVLKRARELAATRLEAAVEDIEVTEDGRLGVIGVPGAGLSWGEIARAAEEEGRSLLEETDFKPGGATFPFGAHVSVVEVDTETGFVRPVRHIAVDDCGVVLNPLLVRGQQHGGAVQGISQALWEQVSYDADGNPITATFADYMIPSAADTPDLETANTVTPTPRNPLGAKGIGESATVGSTPAVQNAVVDALKHLGVRHVDMPASPLRVWQAIQNAHDGGPTSPWREPPAVFDTLPVRVAGDSRDADEAVA